MHSSMMMTFCWEVRWGGGGGGRVGEGGEKVCPLVNFTDIVWFHDMKNGTEAVCMYVMTQW